MYVLYTDACTNVYIVQHTQWFVYVHTWWRVQTHETLLTTECRCHRCRVMGSAFVWYTCEHDISAGMFVLLGYKQPPPSLRRQHYHAVWYTMTELGQILLSGCSNLHDQVWNDLATTCGVHSTCLCLVIPPSSNIPSYINSHTPYVTHGVIASDEKCLKLFDSCKFLTVHD